MSGGYQRLDQQPVQSPIPIVECGEIHALVPASEKLDVGPEALH